MQIEHEAKSGPPKKKPPPIAAKQKIILHSDPSRTSTSSPWEREKMEKENKEKEEELRRYREGQIKDLESRSYLSAEEVDRLRKLRLDQKFDRRVQEVSALRTDDDHDITQRGSVSEKTDFHQT